MRRERGERKKERKKEIDVMRRKRKSGTNYNQMNDSDGESDWNVSEVSDCVERGTRFPVALISSKKCSLAQESRHFSVVKVGF